jgi:hypothetical protein
VYVGWVHSVEPLNRRVLWVVAVPATAAVRESPTFTMRTVNDNVYGLRCYWMEKKARTLFLTS